MANGSTIQITSADLAMAEKAGWVPAGPAAKPM
jgi:hypothetical protein